MLLYDIRTDSCKRFKVNGAFKFTNYFAGNYPIAQCGHNKVVALVATFPDFKPRLIKYVKETNSITILDKF